MNTCVDDVFHAHEEGPVRQTWLRCHHEPKFSARLRRTLNLGVVTQLENDERSRPVDMQSNLVKTGNSHRYVPTYGAS